MGRAHPLVECVPNFSEGRRPEVIACLVAASVAEGARILDTHSDVDHNRTVLTIAGIPDAVVAAAVGAASEAVRLIDLRQHRGVHPRLGAVDVIPLVPLRAMPVERCVAMAEAIGARLATEFGLPVYLYGMATRPGRPAGLAEIRGRGFEALQALGSALPPPDFGPGHLHPTAGAVAVGVRDPLLAFNVELSSSDLGAARAIAASVRTSSGGLPAVQASGLPLASRGTVQVSMNLLDFRVTGLDAAFSLVRDEASRRGIEVAGCELVGLLPEAALPATDPGVPGWPSRSDTIESHLAADDRGRPVK